MNEILHEIKFWPTLYVYVFILTLFFWLEMYSRNMTNARNVHREDVLQNHVTVVILWIKVDKKTEWQRYISIQNKIVHM